MPQANLVGEFLRARRAQLHPEEVGLSARDGRRVPGLRREELAVLAGVSCDYYTRLEQGRSLPSLQVTQALARALKLDAAATSHLHQLAGHAPDHLSHDVDTLSARGLQTLLDQWPATPAWVSDRHAQVMAANALIRSLNPTCAPGSNSLRELFAEEARMREFYVDYEDVAAAAVASLRARNGAELDDRELSALVSELTHKSTLFARLWSRHDVRFHTAGLNIIRLRHPDAGRMEFHTESMVVNGRVGAVLTVYYADPDSATARKLAELSSTTTRRARQAVDA
jgi:transcriptional regulator with XRE-family HTH domain